MALPQANRLLRRALQLVALAGGGEAAESPGSWIFPPLDGELAGEFTALLLPGAPPVKWKVVVHTERPRERTVTVAVDGAGLKARGGGVLDPRGEGSWTLRECEIDLAEWYGWVAPRFGPDFGSTSLDGTLIARGAGTWRSAKLTGRIDVELRDGRFEDPAHKVVIEGLAGRVVVEDLTAPRTAPAQRVAWRSGRYDAVPFGPGRVEFSLAGSAVSISAASVAIFGGELSAGAMQFSTTKPELAVTARIAGIDLEKILFLLPPVLASAQGRLDGTLALHRNAAGIQLGVGRLSLRQGETADLRLAPSPGLLSSRLPAAMQQHYPGLGRMETGGIPLRAELLEVILSPQGDAQGRTAAVRIEGGPADPALKAPVVLEINVRGPLDSLVKFGTNSKLRFGEAR